MREKLYDMLMNKTVGVKQVSFSAAYELTIRKGKLFDWADLRPPVIKALAESIAPIQLIETQEEPPESPAIFSFEVDRAGCLHVQSTFNFQRYKVVAAKLYRSLVTKVPGVDEVAVGHYGLTIHKGALFRWEDMHAKIVKTVKDALAPTQIELAAVPEEIDVSSTTEQLD